MASSLKKQNMRPKSLAAMSESYFLRIVVILVGVFVFVAIFLYPYNRNVLQEQGLQEVLCEKFPVDMSQVTIIQFTQQGNSFIFLVEASQSRYLIVLKKHLLLQRFQLLRLLEANLSELVIGINDGVFNYAIQYNGNEFSVHAKTFSIVDTLQHGLFLFGVSCLCWLVFRKKSVY